MCYQQKNNKLTLANGREPLILVFIIIFSNCKNQQCKPESGCVVFIGKGQALIGRNTALQLDVLQIVLCVFNFIYVDKHSVYDKYLLFFKGLGKFNSFQLWIPIDPNVELITKPWSRYCTICVKFSQGSLYTARSGHRWTRWRAVLMGIASCDDYIRFCVDIPQTNTAVKSNSPTIDKLLHEMNSNTI